MKKIIQLVACTLTLIACNSNPNGFTIEGTIAGELEDGTAVYLKKTNEQKQPVNVDTTTIKNGKFVFTGTSELPELHYVFIDKVNGYVPVIVEEGTVMLTAQKDSLNFARLKGSEQNEFFDSYMKDSRELSQKAITISNDMRNANAAGNSDVINSLQEEYAELQEEFKNFEISFIKENPNALISVLLIEKVLVSKTLPNKEVQELFESLTPEIKQIPVAKEIGESLQKEKSTAIGSEAPNFTAPTPTGEELALNDVLGKVTIIDFWAAWCKPCRAENPNVVRVYDTYHEKGLNIIGVSLDKSADDWKKAIADDGLEWNHVSHVQYFKDPIARLYNINAIPATFILDENGVIVAKNLRGKELEDTVAQMLQ